MYRPRCQQDYILGERTSRFRSERICMLPTTQSFRELVAGLRDFDRSQKEFDDIPVEDLRPGWLSFCSTVLGCSLARAYQTPSLR